MGKKQWESQELHLALLGYLPSAVLASQGLLCLGVIDNGMRMPASLCAQCKAVLVIKLSLRSVQPDAEAERERKRGDQRFPVRALHHKDRAMWVVVMDQA